MKVLIALITLFFAVLVNYNQQLSKQLVYKDAAYEEEIRTVQLYPDNNHNQDVLDPPVAQLGQVNLVLEFDDLVQSPEDYRVRIIHCNQDWTPSRLSTIDYLYDYNEFTITNDQSSADTKVAYIHYIFRLPQVKLPGNYLLVAYRGTNQSDIILSKRFMVYTNNVTLQTTSSLNGFTSIDRTKQQIDFTINYQNYELINPTETVKVTIRQNERWDNTITNLKPSAVKDYTSELEYRFFNFENSFSAGNEYRFFDIRSIRNPGQGVKDVNWSAYPYEVNLFSDQPRIYQAYSHLDDINGDYYIINVDASDGDTHADYINTKFSLKTDFEIPGDIYVVGKMNNWELENENKMKYDRRSQLYTTDLILKQGWYNYKYYVKNDTLNANYLEGNHFQTENHYELFVYYRPPNKRADLLIGYGFFEVNPQ